MTERFDGVAVWSKLTSQQQAEIGPLALERAAARYSAVSADDVENPFVRPVARAAEFADTWLDVLFHEAIAVALPRSLFACDDGQPRLPSRLGQVCRACGCSSHDACPGGCEWVAEDLCSACADRGVR